MTNFLNRNAIVAAAVVAAILVGQSMNATAYAQDTDAFNSEEVSANVADFTAGTSAQLSDRLSAPSFDLEAKLAELEVRSTIKPDYASYQREDRDEEQPVVVASIR